MKRQHYTNEEKEKMLFRYASEQTDVQDLLQEAGIPKSTFNQWLREYDAQHNCQSENDYSPRNFRHLKLRNQHLEDIIAVLNDSYCSPRAPLRERLNEAERLKSSYNTHLVCEALGLSRGTFYNHIKRMQLTMEQIEHEMKVIADSGMEEILILTGESRAKSSVEYIGEACKLARKYFRMVGIEVYPVNVDEYRYLHECGVDYVTVFQETYDKVRFEKLHLLGHKRVFPYRFDSQERALMAGMRGVAFSALLGLSDFRRDALASALHVYYLQKKYPHAEMSLSCPRLRPIINNDKIDPLDVHEKELCQVLCAYRIFLPFVGITVSSRESKEFRNGIVKIAATKVSAGVSTGIGDHESKYSGHDDGEGGDEQFEINDSRSFNDMYGDISGEGLQPVLNDYLYV